MREPGGLGISSILRRLSDKSDVGQEPQSEYDERMLGPGWKVDKVADFSGWPSGIAISSHGRIFVSFPKTNGQLSPATLCEIVDGYASPFPFDSLSGNPASQPFSSIQGLRCAANDRLYALDAGATALWVLDAHSGRVVHHYGFSADVVSPTTFLNDLALDLAHGGTAYILDSGVHGPNALIVLDLASGHARRVLNDHPSMRASGSLGRRGVLADGKPLLVREPGGRSHPLQAGVVGVALLTGDNRLYWAKPDTLYSVPTALLVDATTTDRDLDAAIDTWPIRPFASDGLVRDAEGHLLFTDVTHNGVQRLSPHHGHYELLAADPRISWPDGIAVGPDGGIYVTSSQFHRSAAFHSGKDKRRPPFGLFRLCPRGRGAPIASEY